MNKRSFLLAATFVLVFVAGLAVMRIWDSYRAGARTRWRLSQWWW